MTGDDINSLVPRNMYMHAEDRESLAGEAVSYMI